MRTLFFFLLDLRCHGAAAAVEVPLLDLVGVVYFANWRHNNSGTHSEGLVAAQQLVNRHALLYHLVALVAAHLQRELALVSTLTPVTPVTPLTPLTESQ